MVVYPDAPIYVDNWIVIEEERDKYLGLEILLLMYHSRFGELLSRLKKYYVKENDKYPNDMTDAYNMLNHYIIDTK